jgi:hypothetical protein
MFSAMTASKTRENASNAVVHARRNLRPFPILFFQGAHLFVAGCSIVNKMAATKSTNSTARS